ncbi:MAG: PQQ-dependent sugar dehydrogenase, partial [Chitinophagales bacterium]
MKKLFFFIALALFICIRSWTQTLPPGFSATSIGSGWVSPVGAVFTGNGQKLFVWEKGGRVYVCNRNGAGNYIKQAIPVLNISEEVGDWRDHGMLGFALDPNFLNNGYIYLLYVVDRHHLVHFGTPNYSAAINQYYAATIGRVTRYQTITNGSGELVANTATRSILIGETKSTGIPILHESHGVGGLAFAADGMLLITAGDGASYNGVDQGSRSDTYFQVGLDSGIIRANENVGAFRSQLISCHSGKLLRIDPATGNGVGSNPFFSAAEPRAPKSRVWAMGFRNPFRVAVKPGTGSTNPSTGDIGEVFVGDVGWNLWEEMNIITEAGMNCGWPLYEGHGTMSSYFTLNRVNPDQPNPLFGNGGCTQQFFTFNNLLKQATADNNTTVYNSCNAAVAIGNHNRYFHRRPGVDWRHGQDVARVGIFNGNIAEVDTIGKPNSAAGGPAFRGNCAVGGTWYNGDAFPADYKNTFFQGDLGGQWLKRVTIDYTDV